MHNIIWSIFTLNSVIFRIFELSEWHLILKDLDSRVLTIIPNETNLEPIFREIMRTDIVVGVYSGV